MRGEPEVGSVIEGRIDALAKADQRIALGQEKRTCDVCGKEWIGPAYCGQGECKGVVFTTVTVRPTAMTVTGRGIAAVVEPPKPKVAATADDVFSLRSLRTSLIDLENRLLNADVHLHQLVNTNSTNHEVFGFLQAAVHQFTETGDYELRIIDPVKATSLLLPIHGLIAEIDRSLAKFEQESKK